MDATELEKQAFFRAGMAGAARSAKSQGPGLMMRALLGRGTDDAIDPAKRIIDSWGGVDNAVIDARRRIESLEAAGVKTPSLARNQLGASNVDASNAINEAIPLGALRDRSHLKRLREDPQARAQHLSSLAQHGFRINDQQYTKALEHADTWRNHISSTADVLVGHRPLEVIRQRFAHGGLVGKGGVLTADILPDADLRRGVIGTKNKLMQGDIGGALKAAPLGLAPMYAANLYWGYGGPVRDASDAISATRGTSENPTPYVGAAISRGLAGAALAPTNLAYGFIGPKIEGAIDRAWGVDPSKLYSQAPPITQR